ncbi:MAG: O-antigen ligase family protein [Fibrobacter sp.]|uniref:O-antigen ligase family protein n=1 Tax=Fibrobacter sp. TaxID=35828 RepID=UPI0025C0BC06|nr:O-antigen ligase family protein [Fibrobacter sp.]MBQ7080404.1 O-antigen ligase family protein [Fibrobacter sp.]
MFVFSILAYILFFSLLFLLIKGNREQQLLSLLLVNILFYINVALIASPELTPFQLLPYVFFAKEILFNFNDFKKACASFPVKSGIAIIFIAYILTTYANGGNAHNFYESFRYCFDKYLPMVAAFICAKDVNEKILTKHLFTFFFIFSCCGLFEFLLNHNYIRETIATAFPSTRATDMFGPAGITKGVNSSSWRPRISLTTKHPTTLGTLLCTMFFFTFAYLKAIPQKNNPKKVKLVLIALVATTILSGSRTALGCIFLGVLLYYTLQLSIKKKIFAFTIYGLLALQMSSIALNSFGEKESGSSLSLRQQQLLFTLIEFSQKPIFGHGLYFTNHTILANDDDGKRLYYSKEETEGLESIVFYTLLDIGLFGAFALLIFYGQTFFYFYRHRDKNAHISTQGMLETSMLVVFLFLSGELGRNTEMCILFIGTSLGLLQQTIENDPKSFEISSSDESE